MVNLLLQNLKGESDEICWRERTGAFDFEDEVVLHAIDVNAIFPFRVVDERTSSAGAWIDDNSNFSPVPLLDIEHVTCRLQFLREIINDILLIHTYAQKGNTTAQAHDW